MRVYIRRECASCCSMNSDNCSTGAQTDRPTLTGTHHHYHLHHHHHHHHHHLLSSTKLANQEPASVNCKLILLFLIMLQKKLSDEALSEAGCKWLMPRLTHHHLLAPLKNPEWSTFLVPAESSWHVTIINRPCEWHWLLVTKTTIDDVCQSTGEYSSWQRRQTEQRSSIPTATPPTNTHTTSVADYGFGGRRPGFDASPPFFPSLPCHTPSTNRHSSYRHTPCTHSSSLIDWLS